MFDPKELNKVLTVLDLPKGISFFHVEGQKLFEIRGATYPANVSYVCYLCTDFKVKRKYLKYGIQLDRNNTLGMSVDVIKKATKSFLSDINNFRESGKLKKSA